MSSVCYSGGEKKPIRRETDRDLHFSPKEEKEAAMSGMHQSASGDQSFGNVVNQAVLHAIDFEDVALSREGARLIHLGARAVMRQFMPGADAEKLTPAQAVALFVDKVFWEENSGGLIMCAEVAEKSLCLPIPSAHWKVRDEGVVIQ